MRCAACGGENDPDARYCDRCGAELSGSAPPSNPPGPAAAPKAAPHPILVYAPVRPRAWWYPIGVWVLLSAFFLFLDLMLGDGVGWAYWPIGILGIFMVGFPLLHLLEAWTSRMGRG